MASKGHLVLGLAPHTLKQRENRGKEFRIKQSGEGERGTVPMRELKIRVLFSFYILFLFDICFEFFFWVL